MNNSQHVADNFYKDCFVLYHTITVLLEYTDCLLQFSTDAKYWYLC